ncbi:MAG TPA: hypothetical protein VLA49_12425 [Anaerolineales bacterium]|nr:hypothetical protein [Anaerolineales bacterium]
MDEHSNSSDIEILRRFEPVLHFTLGERFFPIDVESYFAECSLWVQKPDGPPELIIREGEVTVENLIVPRQGSPGTIYYLKFIEPPDLLEYARYQIRQVLRSLSRQDEEEKFRPGRGRLARVGFGSRFIDALFSLTLLLRGRVPGDAAAAAIMTYDRMQSRQERYSYYGRVVRENGWVILQYWYFYPYNNWRSGFFGVNDHEADWEMVCIYCFGDPDPKNTVTTATQLKPQWVAYASHEFHGDDLRRRWDDPELEKIITEDGGQHPVVYVGAGSHASYFAPGEYLAELELPLLSPLVFLVDRLQSFGHKVLKLGRSLSEKPKFNIFRIPFVDYARGDGRIIGPEQGLSWEAHLIGPETPWVFWYRGLWGLYARDPISGENAPAGPIYNRTGDVRRRWYDPLGWAGLDKVASPSDMIDVLTEESLKIQLRSTGLEDLIEQKSKELTGLGIAEVSLRGHLHLEDIHREHLQHINVLSEELMNLRHELAVEKLKLEALHLHKARLERGELEPARDHLRHAHHPTPHSNLFLANLAEFFAAINVGILILGILILIVFARQYLLNGLAIMVGFIIFMEAGFRRQLDRLINGLTIGLAGISVLVLLKEFLWEIIVTTILLSGIFIIVDNLREFFRR